MRNYTNLNLYSLQKNLKVIRKLLNLTCEEFGGMLGCTKQTISNYEAGRVVMPKYMGIAIYAVIDSLSVEENIRQVIDILLDEKEPS